MPERVAGSIWLKVRNVPTSDGESIITHYRPQKTLRRMTTEPPRLLWRDL